MSTEDPSTPSPTSVTVSPTTGVLKPSKLIKTEESWCRVAHLSREEASLIQSIRDVTTSYDCSIHRSLRIEHKGDKIRCAMYLNHQFLGRLYVQVDMWKYFEDLMACAGFEILQPEDNGLADAYELFVRIRNDRKLH